MEMATLQEKHGILSIPYVKFRQFAKESASKTYDLYTESGNGCFIIKQYICFPTKEQVEQFLKDNPDYHIEDKSCFVNWQALGVPKELSDNVYLYWLSDLERFGLYTE